MATQYTTKTFTHEGHQLVYDDYGEGERLLVYVHGLLSNSDMNRGLAKALAERGNRVVLLDLLGHGRSDKPAHASEYRIDTYSNQVFALLDELGVDKAVLGGMSLGANVSLFAATRRPERVRGLVLEMPVLENAVPTAAILFAPLSMLVNLAKPLLRRTADWFAGLPGTPFATLNSGIRTASVPPESVAAVLHGILVGPVAPTQEERAAIEAPALILAHTYDLIHPFDDADNLAAQMPNATLVPARSPIELRLQPKRLTGEIALFLEGVWGFQPADDRGRSRRFVGRRRERFEHAPPWPPADRRPHVRWHRSGDRTRTGTRRRADR